MNVIASQIGVRPVGTEANASLLKYVKALASSYGYKTTTLPFECKIWNKGVSNLTINNKTYGIYPSPFSQPYKGECEIIFADSVETLQKADCAGKVVAICGTLANDAIMPKNFPFFFPEEHKFLIELLESKQPAAILAFTGKQPMSGLDPFPLFEDGNFLIPSAYISQSYLDEIKSFNKRVEINIDSHTQPSESEQLIIWNNLENKERIVICAHMDSKYNTPAALDNGAGVAVLLEMMRILKDEQKPFDIEFVPFNSEEYYGVCGQLNYMNRINNELTNIKLVINIDSPCHKDSKTALSFYNFTDDVKQKYVDYIKTRGNVVTGPEWYAGDHAMFAFRGIPCLAVTSSNLFDGVLELSHTPKDTIENVDYELIKNTADVLVGIITNNLIEGYKYCNNSALSV